MTESQNDLGEAWDDMHVDNDMERVDDRGDEVRIRPDLKKILPLNYVANSL